MTSSVMERADTYLEGVTAETFSLDEYLLGIDDRLLATPAGRRALTELDPLLFALVYLPHHLLINGEITFSDFHLDAFREARRWIVMATEPAQDRDAYIAPRESGKSTMFFLLLPMWAAAFLHRRFAAAFADSASQAQKHLKTFKLELENNQALRCDFPLLCAPALRPRGQTVSDSQGLLVSKSGFAFGAAGLDSSSLGMKIGAQRPDLIVLDDIEPDESNYSPYLKQKRLATIRQSIFPLNIYARIVMVGTTTMFGSVMHDIVRCARGDRDVPEWVAEEKVRGHYYGAIVSDPVTGAERSLWPAKWSLTYLLSIRHTRQYRLNYENDPLGRDGDFWRIEDIAYGTTPAFTGQLLSIDPAVTSKERSDYTALSVIAYYAPERKVVVRDAWALRIPPGELLRARVLSILEEYPGIAGVLVESNQGAEVWRAILHDLPVKLRLVHQSAPKEVRAARLLAHYQRGRVLHEKRMPELEGQLVSFPKGANDDLVDSVGTGAAVFLDQPKKRSGVSSQSYV
jgi:phage terminase large subunit-like protein